jgi:hypothetical protein
MPDSFTFKIQGFGNLRSMKFAPDKSVRTLTNLDPIHYQKVGRFSKDGKIFVAGTSDGHVFLIDVAIVLELARDD